MKKETRIYLILGVIIILIIIGVFWLKKNGETPEEKLAKCIAEKSELYIQLGCPACEKQEELFGNTYKYLNVTDCHYELEKCIEVGITYTPTWIINEKLYEGVRKIEELKKLTGC